MKNIIILLLWSGILYICTNAQAQRCPGRNLGCRTTFDENVWQQAQSYANWNWEICDTEAKYCDTWSYKNTQGRIVTIGPPWNNAPSDYLTRIADNEDFKKEDGWELIKKNFGMETVVRYPHFVLYNKYQGLMRFYFYYAKEDPYNNLIVTLNHNSNNTKNSCINSFASGLSKAPDKYLSGTASSNDEVTVFVIQQPAEYKWAVAEFKPMFDPNIKDAAYNNSLLFFEMYGFNESTITLSGNLDFTTTSTLSKPYGNYSFSGNRASIMSDLPAVGGNAPLKRFTLQSQKYLSFGEKPLDYLNKIDTATTKVIAFINKENLAISQTPYGFSQAKINFWSSTLDKANKVKDIASSTSKFGSAIRTVAKVSKGLSGAVGFIDETMGFIGEMIGMFRKNKSATTAVASEQSSEPIFVPTHSNGTLKLTGFITSKKFSIDFVQFMVPGSNHIIDDATQPYYDCPLGIFNIANTPILQKITYNRWVGEEGIDQLNRYYVRDLSDRLSSLMVHPQQYFRQRTQRYESFDSYKVKNLVIPAYNKAAGLELVSVEAALVAELPKTKNPDVALFRPNTNSTYNWGCTQSLPYNGVPNCPGGLNPWTVDGLSYKDANGKDQYWAGGGNGYTTYSKVVTIFPEYFTANYYMNYMLSDLHTSKTLLTNFAKDSNYIVMTPFVDIKNFKDLAFTVKSGSKVYVKIKAILKKAGDADDEATPIFFIKEYAVDIETVAKDANAAYNKENSFDVPPPYSNYSQVYPNRASDLYYDSNKKLGSEYELFASNTISIKQTTYDNHPTNLYAGKGIEFGDYFINDGVEMYASNEYWTDQKILSNSLVTPIAFNDICGYNNNGKSYRVSSEAEVIEQAEETVDVLIYPNPADEKINIKWISDEKSLVNEISIFNMLGERVRLINNNDLKSNLQEIDISDLPTGILMVQLKSKTKTKSFKIIHQKH